MQNDNIKFKIIFITIILFGFFGLAKSSQAADYYVATNGNDNNNGSISAPWVTIQKAADTVSAGDTVNVRAGTYNERVTLTTSGTSGNYITFQPYTGETVHIMGGTGQGYKFVGYGLSYIKIIGFKIHDFEGSGIGFFGGGSHIEIRDNEIYNMNVNTIPTVTRAANPNCGTWGHAIIVSTEIWGPPASYPTLTDLIIDNNYLHNIITGCEYEHEALSIFYNVQRFQITNNTLNTVTHIGINMTGMSYMWHDPYSYIDAYPNGGIVSGNTIKDVGSFSYDTGLYINGARNVTLENNTVYDGIGTGIAPSTEQLTSTTENIIVRLNKVWNNLRQVYIGAATTGGNTNNSRWVHNTFVMKNSGNFANIYFGNGTGNIVKNNIFYKTAGTYMMQDSSGISTVTLNYNNYYDPSTSYFMYGGSSYLGFTAYKNGTGQDTNSITTDPKFTNISTNDFTLQSSSPAIDAGDFLTRTTSSGSGTTIVVSDARYFNDGYGIAGVSGDEIKVGNNSVAVTAVDYNSNTITVDRNISWNNNEGVSYAYSGNKPDIGAYEYVSVGDTTPPASPTGLSVN